jgi:hypothetical protein
MKAFARVDQHGVFRAEVERLLAHGFERGLRAIARRPCRFRRGSSVIATTS